MTGNYKAITWEMDKPIEVELSYDSPIESQSKKFNKTNYWYGIKELITGENGFNATAKLHETIQSLGKKQGDKLVIKKVNNGTYTFFTVDDNQLQKNDANTNVTNKEEILVSEIRPEVPEKVQLRDLTERVEKIEAHLKKISADNIKTGDDEIPF
tara:strand:+ start:1768 stop:2232 length:465 start_codon:yes stop_codon:yes gene_type:complete